MSITALAAPTRLVVSATTNKICASGLSASRVSCPISISRSNNIWVKGPPWHTMVFVQWDGTATLLNGGGYFQHAIHVITRRWGKIAALDVDHKKSPVRLPFKLQPASKRPSPNQS